MMKKFLNAILLLALLPMSLLAQSIDLPQVSPQMETNAHHNRVSYMLPNVLPQAMKPVPNYPLGAKYISLPNAQGNPLRGSWMLQDNTEPMVYEPKSNTYVIVYRDIFATEEGQPFHLQTGTTSIITSGDNGKTWTPPQLVWDQQSHFGVMPSLAVANPTGSSNPANFSYFIYSRLAKAEEGQTSAPFIGAQFLFVTPDFSDAISLTGPEQNNPNQRQRWFKTKITSFSHNDHDRAVLAGQLTPQEGFQGGNYGAASIDLTNIDYSSTIPNAWAVSKFRQSTTPSTGSHYNNQIYIDNDNSGNIYAVVANMFIEDPDSRIVGFSKSADQGNTWSEFVKMPKQVLENYAVGKGALKDSAFFISYQQDALVAYGEDQFSYFARVYVNMPFPVADESHIVEVNYNQGTWSMRTVAKLLQPEEAVGRMWGISLQRPQESSTSEEEIPFLYDNGYEIDAAKSLDGHIIVKWLDHRADIINFETQQIAIRNRTDTDNWNFNVYNWENLPSNDVFMSYRKFNETSWVSPRNVTDDVRYNRNTFMPRLVKDLLNVPVLQLKADETNIKRISTTTGLPVFPQYVDFPSFLCEMITDINLFYFMEVNMVNAVNPSSVDDVIVNNNSIDIYPNPVSNMANFNISVADAGVAAIRISNSLGQLVAEIPNQEFYAGNFATQFDTSNLPIGTYYVTLTINGKSSTKVMNIVR